MRIPVRCFVILGRMCLVCIIWKFMHLLLLFPPLPEEEECDRGEGEDDQCYANADTGGRAAGQAAGL